MSYTKLNGSSAFALDQPLGYQDANEARENDRLFAFAGFSRNQYMGGSTATSIPGDTAGDFDLPHLSIPFVLDNSSSQISGASGVVIQVRFFVRVSNAAITVTPRIYNITAAGVATTTGQAACSATNSDYSGTNQQQTLALTLATASNAYKAQLTIGGTPAGGYEVWGYAIFDCYVP